jgi:hypothetical protein
MPKPTLPRPGSAVGAYEAAHQDHESSHDLEAHMDELRTLDERRERCADMKKKGHEALLEFRGRACASRVLYEKYKHARICLQLARGNAQIAASRAAIKDLQDGFSLAGIKGEYAPVLAAAEAMRMFVSTGDLAISRQTMLAWYLIVREIFTAAKPDWCIGGVRAGEQGWVTAYSTCQCVRALCDLADTLERTGALLDYMHKLSLYLDTLEYPGIPAAWLKIDKERLRLELQNELASASRKVAFDVAGLIESADDVETIVEAFKEIAKASLTQLERDLKTVRDSDLPREGKPSWPALAGHEFAIRAIMTGIDMNEETLRLLSGKHWMKAVGQKFRSAAQGVRESLDACRSFLSSVIDGQLAASNHADTRTWEPIELAYAAPAYARILGKEKELETGAQARLKHAANLICADLSADGTLSSRTPFHAAGHSQYSVQTDELLGAVAELIRLARFPLDRRLAKHLLHYFERQCAYKEDGTTIVGWFNEFDHHRKSANLIASVDAVESLASLNRMLDEGINDIILDHFKVYRSRPSGVALGDLFYPDYGLVEVGGKASAEPARRASVALALQHMRTHVTGWAESACMSVVLHGPGGTGKTTLIESLAHTCRVPLVEVTPSDLVKGGEDNVEGRARAVFETLSMLSEVVILFDEFDPILKRRDASGEKETNFYSFLTPGMLPKLKDLHERAKKRRVAYALITNLVGTLDAPAIRKGRFDEVIGIYPPDPLSRAGYFARVAGCLARADGRGWDPTRFVLSKLIRVVARTRSIGMTTATSAGWFRAGDKSDLSRSAAAYIYSEYDEWDTSLEPEDEFDGVRGVGRFAEREHAEWHTLDAWDAEIDKFEQSCAKKKTGIEAEWDDKLAWPLKAEVAAKLKKARDARTAGSRSRRKPRRRVATPRFARAK